MIIDIKNDDKVIETAENSTLGRAARRKFNATVVEQLSSMDYQPSKKPRTDLEK